MDISKNISYYRSQKGVTQQWLADAIDASKMSISNFENGKRRPDIATIKKICKALYRLNNLPILHCKGLISYGWNNKRRRTSFSGH